MNKRHWYKLLGHTTITQTHHYFKQLSIREEFSKRKEANKDVKMERKNDAWKSLTKLRQKMVEKEQLLIVEVWRH
jgi:hypothetical protein